MADKAERSDLDAVLSRLESNWRELAELVRHPAPSSPAVLEAEKFLLKDAAGRARGELCLTAEGGAALILNDAEGKVRAQLGLSDKGRGFLTLRDQYGGIIFQAADGSRPPGPPGAGPARPPLDPVMTARLEQMGGELAALRELLQSQARPAPSEPVPAPEAAAEPGLADRLECVEGQVRGWKWTGAAALILGLLALAGLGLTLSRVQWRGAPVAAEAFILKGPAGAPLALLKAQDSRPRLDFLDQEGKTRASLGLEADFAPALKLYDREQKPRAGLELGPEGDPSLNLRDQAAVLRAALGNVGPQNLGPESTLIRPTASLTFFDGNGRLLWMTPLRWRP